TFDQVLKLFKGKSLPPAASDRSGSWPVLFGRQAWCDCQDCQSVFSPAAYFVDLLSMLDPDDKAHPPAHFLFKRRPDLKHLKLSCANTNTTIPCVDLVNEILEAYIISDQFPKARRVSHDSGNLSAEELRAVPQFVDDRVYARLAGEVFPLSLPFHRPLA